MFSLIMGLDADVRAKTMVSSTSDRNRNSLISQGIIYHYIDLSASEW
jgi:hypothetical protein